MSNLPEAMHGLFRKARRGLGLTQSELARAVGCRQSAISMFESGQVHALSQETLAELAKVLHIEILPSASGPSADHVLKYCPIAGCPTNLPYLVNDQLCFKPSAVRERAADRGHCAYCGELLESSCANPDCHAPVSEGAFCWNCGEAYVAPAVSVTLPKDEWVRDRLERIREIRQLTTPTIRESSQAPAIVHLGDHGKATPTRNRRAR